MQQQVGEPVIPLSDPQIQTNHSLSADIAMGWKPKLKVIGPIPLNFDNQYIDRSIKELLKSQTSMYRVVYLGARPLNTFKMHQIIKRKYKYKYQHLFSVEYGHLKAFFHKFYSQFQPKMKLPFLGMNPAYKQHKLIFDSCFQSGNLDSVVQVSDNQYDLSLRIDSNTSGHIMWYYFHIRNPESTSQNIKLNIINLRNNKSCYQRGMKPFMRRKKKQSTNHQEWTQWAQDGDNVQAAQAKVRFAKEILVINNGMIGFKEEQALFRRLSFQCHIQPHQQIQFAYCVPYTYSDLVHDIKHLKHTVAQHKNIHFEIDTKNQSLSGLQIPILKITEKLSERYDDSVEKDKFCIFILGRQHPGQSNGSYVMKGILQELIKNSEQMNFLRKHCVLKIIPMLNVDGTVMGNFRTSLYGKDLNRLFKKKQLFLIPEVQMCKEEFSNLMKIHRQKILLFLDVHGHSVRRNSFCYGPGILDANAFSDVRQLAKMIAARTQIFRYPSCTFRINNDKKTTARACFSKSVGLAYTIQSSNWSYYSKSNAKMINFTAFAWKSVGHYLTEGIFDYIQEKILKKISRNKKKKDKQKRKAKISDLKNQLNSKYIKNDKNEQSSNKQSFKKIAVQERYELKVFDKESRPGTNSVGAQIPLIECLSQSQNLSQHSQSPQKQSVQISQKYKIIQIPQQQNQSDKMSQKQMDSDSQGQDMQKQKFQHFITGAKRMMIQFEKVYLGDDYQQKGRTSIKLRNDIKKQHNNKNLRKKVQVLACLRKKQPIINGFNSLQDDTKIIDIAGKIKLQPRKLATLSSNFGHHQMIRKNESIQKQFQSNENYKILSQSNQLYTQDMPLMNSKIILPKIDETYRVLNKRSQKSQISKTNSNQHHQHNKKQRRKHSDNIQQDDLINGQIYHKRKSLTSYDQKDQINRINNQVTKQNQADVPYEQSKYQTFQSKYQNQDALSGFSSATSSNNDFYQQTNYFKNYYEQEDQDQEKMQVNRFAIKQQNSSSSEQNSQINIINNQRWNHFQNAKNKLSYSYKNQIAQSNDIKSIKDQYRYNFMEHPINYKLKNQYNDLQNTKIVKDKELMQQIASKILPQFGNKEQQIKQKSLFSVKSSSQQLTGGIKGLSLLNRNKQIKSIPKSQNRNTETKQYDPPLKRNIINNHQRIHLSQQLTSKLRQSQIYRKQIGNKINFQIHQVNYIPTQKHNIKDINQNSFKIQQLITNNLSKGNSKQHNRGKIDKINLNRQNQGDKYIQKPSNAYLNDNKSNIIQRQKQSKSQIIQKINLQVLSLKSDKLQRIKLSNSKNLINQRPQFSKTKQKTLEHEVSINFDHINSGNKNKINTNNIRQMLPKLKNYQSRNRTKSYKNQQKDQQNPGDQYNDQKYQQAQQNNIKHPQAQEVKIKYQQAQEVKIKHKQVIYNKIQQQQVIENKIKYQQIIQNKNKYQQIIQNKNKYQQVIQNKKQKQQKTRQNSSLINNRINLFTNDSISKNSQKLSELLQSKITTFENGKRSSIIKGKILSKQSKQLRPSFSQHYNNINLISIKSQSRQKKQQHKQKKQQIKQKILIQKQQRKQDRSQFGQQNFIINLQKRNSNLQTRNSKIQKEKKNQQESKDKIFQKHLIQYTNQKYNQKYKYPKVNQIFAVDQLKNIHIQRIDNNISATYLKKN